MSIYHYNEWSLERIIQCSTPIKIGITIGLVLLYMGFGYALVIRDNLSQYHALCAKELSMKKKLESKKKQLIHGEEEHLKQGALQSRFSSLLKAWPLERDMPSLLDELSSIAISEGVRFEFVDPTPAILHDFYSELPIKMVVFGSYNQLLMFFTRVSKMHWMITWHDFLIENQLIKKRKEQLRMHITAVIYFLRKT